MKASPVRDPDISAVRETLRIAEDALTIDPNGLASQLVARLYEVLFESYLKSFRISFSFHFISFISFHRLIHG